MELLLTFVAFVYPQPTGAPYLLSATCKYSTPNTTVHARAHLGSTAKIVESRLQLAHSGVTSTCARRRWWLWPSPAATASFSGSYGLSSRLRRSGSPLRHASRWSLRHPLVEGYSDLVQYLRKDRGSYLRITACTGRQGHSSTVHGGCRNSEPKTAVHGSKDLVEWEPTGGPSWSQQLTLSIDSLACLAVGKGGAIRFNGATACLAWRWQAT